MMAILVIIIVAMTVIVKMTMIIKIIMTKIKREYLTELKFKIILYIWFNTM